MQSSSEKNSVSSSIKNRSRVFSLQTCSYNHYKILNLMLTKSSIFPKLFVQLWNNPAEIHLPETVQVFSNLTPINQKIGK